MCGIVGALSPKEFDHSFINQMTDSVLHRGPDGRGTIVFDEKCEIQSLEVGAHNEKLPSPSMLGQLSLGHRRLSVIDLESSSNQPMSYLNRRYWIVFNGEIFNYIELKKELETLGHRFETDSDTEVILAAYDQWGIACQNKFNGMWAFCIVDRFEKHVFLSRDRFGEKPLYYSVFEGVFYFSSEIKALFSTGKIKANIYAEKAISFIKNGPNEYGKETIYHEIFNLMPGCYFDINFEDDLQLIEQKKYWELQVNHSHEAFNKEKALNYSAEYYELLKDSVRLRLRSDVPLGSALSGGLDSSSIVYLVKEILSEHDNQEYQKTFSCVYKDNPSEQYCDESKFIDLLTKKLGIKNYQITPKVRDVPSEHTKMIHNFDSPPENTCMSGWYTYKLVQESNIVVTLDGQGADEQLTGYIYYFAYYLANLKFSDLIREAVCALQVPTTFPYVWRGVVTNIFTKIFGKKITKKLIEGVLKRPFPESLNGILYHDFTTGLVNLLHNADKASMAHSVESRMPFLDFRLVEFLANIPSAYKIHNGWSKYLARLAFDGKLPDEICWRKDKQGWPIPEDYWFSGDLKVWLKESLSDSNKYPGILDRLDNEEYSPGRKVGMLRSLNFLTTMKTFNASILDRNG
tara:strand:- start:4936 stop:6825 length:1890 start_codon:yes stop_codon:yes gene_type:complete